MKYFALALVVSVSFIMSSLSVGAYPIKPKARKLGDVRFLTDLDPVIGKTAEEITERFGEGHLLRAACAIPFLLDGNREGKAEGDLLNYRNQTSDTVAVRNICLIHGVVAGDQLSISQVKGSQITTYTTETADPELAAVLSTVSSEKEMEETLQRYNDPIIPKGREIEI